MPSASIANPGAIPPAVPFPMIVTIIGPSRHAASIERLAHAEEMDGRIAVVPHVRAASLPTAPLQRDYYKARYHDLTCRKIDMADEVVIVCHEDEVTEDLVELAAYAKSLRKPVHRWAPESVS